MPGMTHPRRSSGGDGECRCGSVLGGGALGRARRVFYEDKRRSNEPHLGPDASQERRRSSGQCFTAPAWRQARGTSVRKKRYRWLARLWKRSRSAAREGALRKQQCLRRAGRARIGARECALGSVTLQVSCALASFCAVTRTGARGPGRRAERTGAGEETEEAPRAQPKPATVHAAWRRKPRLSGTTRGSSQDDLRADAGGRNRAPPGSPRSDEASEVRTAGAIGEDNAPGIRLSSLK
jgi:hypothetical protein